MPPENNRFRLGGLELSGDRPPAVIAEIGVNFNGEMDLAKASIDAAVAAGAEVVKFQTFRAEEFVADRELTYSYGTGKGAKTENVFEMFKRLELPKAWHKELQDHARRKGALFLSSAADPISADLLKDIGAPAIKIASEDAINLPLLKHVAKMGLPVILSTGMADEKEIDAAVALLRGGGCRELMLLHCVSLYPTPENELNLARMTSLAERYRAPVGFSDHSQGIAAAAAATMLGALLIEKHFTVDRGLPGPDHAMSSDPKELKDLVATVKEAHTLRGSAAIAPSPGELKARKDFRRSVVAARDLSPGTVLKAGDLALKRPHTGLHPRHLDELVGRKLRNRVAPDQQLRWEDLE